MRKSVSQERMSSTSSVHSTGTMRNDTNSTGRVLLYRSSTYSNCKSCFGILTFHRGIEKPGVRSINRKGGNLLIKCNSTKNERPDFWKEV